MDLNKVEIKELEKEEHFEEYEEISNNNDNLIDIKPLGIPSFLIDYGFKLFKANGKAPNNKTQTISINDLSYYNDLAFQIPKGYVVIDIDFKNGEQRTLNEISDIFDTFVVRTSRGYHLYYTYDENLNLSGDTKETSSTSDDKKNYVGQTTYCGLKVDYKWGHKISFVNIKKDGTLRDFNNKQIKELPKALYPFKKDSSELESVTTICHGTRHDYLFRLAGKHTNNIAKNIITETELENILQVANSLFQDAYDETEFIDELNNIKSSNSAFTGGKFDAGDLSYSSNINMDLSKIRDVQTRTDKGKLDFVSIANGLFLGYFIFLFRGALFFRRKDTKTLDFIRILRSNTSEIGRIMFREWGELTAREEQNKVFDMVYNMAKKIEDEKPLPIAFKNGFIIDVEQGIVRKHNNEFTLNVLDTNYNPTVTEHHTVDTFLNFLSNDDKDVIKLFKQILGHCLFTNNVPQYAYFLEGAKGGNGKSTFTQMIRETFGVKNVSTHSLEQLDEDIFRIEAATKLVNIGDDINGGLLEKSDTFKTFSAGSPVTVRELYEQPITIKPYCTLIFPCNNMPIFKDKTGGLIRRLIIIPCKNTVPVEKRDPRLLDKLLEDNAKSYLLNLALEGVNILNANNCQIEKPDVVNEAIEDYLTRSDSFLGYVKGKEQSSFVAHTTHKIYTSYTSWCNDEGLKHMLSKNNFTRRLQEHFNLKLEKDSGENVFVENYDNIAKDNQII